MIRFHDTHLSERDARTLLQKLRDLNLLGCAIEVAASERVRLEGCLSLDAPVERGVRYRLRRGDGRTEVLSLAFSAGRLWLARAAECLEHTDGARAGFGAEAFADRFGRVAVPELGARIDLAFLAPRELEHFLRRVVRSAFRSRA